MNGGWGGEGEGGAPLVEALDLFAARVIREALVIPDVPHTVAHDTLTMGRKMGTRKPGFHMQ